MERVKIGRNRWSDREIEVLRQIYSDNGYRRKCNDVAAVRLQRTRAEVMYKAVELGLTHVRERLRWTEAEMDCLARFCHEAPETIQKRLRSVSSFPRTRSAIVGQIWRMHLRSSSPNGLNHEDLCQVLGLTRDTLHGYRRQGLIKGARLNTLLERPKRGKGSRTGKSASFLNTPWFYHNRDIEKFICVYPGLLGRRPDVMYIIDLLRKGRHDAAISKTFEEANKTEREKQRKRFYNWGNELPLPGQE